MKRYNIIALALALMLGLTATLMNPTETYAEDYGDVCEFEDVRDESSYFYKPVYWAKVTEVTTGRSKKTENGGKIFDPYATCTRAEIVTYLWRAAGKPSPKASECKFDDVSSDSYYCKAVQWAYENKITTGRSHTNNFDPNATCTRREIVTFLWRYAGKPEPKNSTSKFTDNQDTSAYYYKAVQWAAEQKISTGTKASNYTEFDTLGKCTRAMSVTFLYRYCAPDFWDKNEATIQYHYWEEKKVLVEWDAEEEVTKKVSYTGCNVCRLDLGEAWANQTDGADQYETIQKFVDAHSSAHMLAREGSGWGTQYKEVTTTETVHHKEWQTQIVCSECGATKE